MKIEKYLPTGQQKRSLKNKVKSFVKFLYIPINMLLTLLSHKDNIEKKFEVSICLIFKNEANYLKEWICYHHLLGVDHFYLYNNNSNDNYIEVLQPYVDDGIITLIQWSQLYAQKAAYQHCYNTFKDETKWLGFIDADEYVNLRVDNSIKTFLTKYKRFPGVYLNWKMFGTSGVIAPPSGCYSVIETYVLSWENLLDHGKTFINTSYRIHEILNAHYSISRLWKLPIYPVGVNRYPSIGFTTFPIGNLTIAYINHYWSKSYSEYIYKDFEKGDVSNIDNIALKRTEGRFKYHELHNVVTDYSIQRWLVFLKI